MKPIKTNRLVNKCKCGKIVTLRRYIWLEEAEDLFDAFKRLRNLTAKHKLRRCWLGLCKCGEFFIDKRTKII